MMNAAELKAHSINWLRFGKQCSMIATECGYWNADVIGLTSTEIIEIETKICPYDLKNDRKKIKHSFYPTASYWTPNIFYFCVPYELEQDAIYESGKLNSKYGVLVHSSLSSAGIRCAKMARPIHKIKYDDRIKNQVLLRMSSELCSFHKKAITYDTRRI